MKSIGSYIKKSVPNHADLLRKFGPGQEEQDHPLRHLTVTLDPTLTDMSKPPKYRADQASIFLAFKHEDLATLFSLARVITCDAMPRVESSTGAYANNIGVWVREEDVKSASALIAQQNWVAKVEPGQAYTVPRWEQETSNRFDAKRRPSSPEVRLSL